MKNIFTKVLLLELLFFGLSAQLEAQSVVATADPDYICYEGSSQLNAASGGITGTLSYSWTPITGLDDPAISNPLASNLTTTIIYTVEVTGNEGTYSDTTTVTVYDEFEIGDISGGTTPICYGDDGGTLQANPANGSGSYTITWYDGNDNEVGSGVTYDVVALTETTAYYYNAVDDEGCGDENSDQTTITVYPEFNIGSISGGNSPICYGDNGDTLYANPTGGSNNYTITWYDGDNNIIGNGLTYPVGTLTETTSYLYNAVDDEGCGDENSELITITVYPEFNIGSINGGDSPICYGDDGGTLQANPTDGSGNYTITWYDENNNQVGSGATYDVVALTETTAFYYNAVDDEGCGDEDSELITITVYPEFNIGSISGGNTPICYGDDGDTLHANPSGGSNSYTITWYDEDNNLIGDGTTYPVGTLTETTSYFYNAADDEGCGDENSDLVTITVYSEFNIGSISGGNTPICYGGDGDTLHSNPSGGSNNYTITWYDGNNSQVGSGPTYAVGLLTETTAYYYNAVDDEGCGDGNSDQTTITVYPEFNIGSISGAISPICYGDDGDTLQANPSGGSNSYTINWFDGDDNFLGSGITIPLGILTESASYYYNAIDEVGCGNENSSDTSIIVFLPLSVGEISGGNSSICSGDDAGNLNAHPEGGSNNYTITWYDGDNNEVGSGPTYAVGVLSETKSYYYNVVDNAGCGDESSDPRTILVNPNLQASVSISVSNNPTCDNEEVIFTISDSLNGGNNPEFEWFINNVAVGTANTWSAYVSDNDEVNTQMHSYAVCVIESIVNSNSIKMSVNTSPMILNSGDLVPKPINNPVVLICVDSLETNTYTWYENGEEIPSANEKFYYPQRYGITFNYSSEYYVMVENEFCISGSNPYIYDFNKSALFEESDVFIVYPNPNNGNFSLVLNEEVVPEDFESANIRILDVSGKVVYKEEIFSIQNGLELMGIQNGLYFLEVIISENQHQVIKLIID